MIYSLLFLILGLYLLPFQESQSLGKFLGTKTLGWGLHQIEFNSFPFVIDVKFDMIDFRTNPISFSLYTKDSYLFACPNSIYRFECEHYKHCYRNKSRPIDAIYPYFELKGEDMSTELIVDQMFHKSQMNAIISDTCIGDLPDYAIGSIGLGVGGPAFDSLPNGPSFVFYIKEDPDNTLSAILFFQKESTMIDVTEDHHQVTANEDWHIKVGSLMMNNHSLQVNSNALLDPNFPFIGIPEDVFTNLLDLLKTHGISCTQTGDHYNCINHNKLENLPNLNFVLADGQISIEPETYLQFGGNPNNYTLLLVPTSSEVTSDFRYVTEPFKDYIILGLPFMTNRYLLFELNVDYVPQISIYSVRSDIDDFAWKKALLIALIAITGVVLMICLVTLFMSAKAKSKKPDRLLERNPHTNHFHQLHNAYSPRRYSRFRESRR